MVYPAQVPSKTKEREFSEQVGQMSLIDETAEVLRFLEVAGKSQILSSSAMHCRISACSKLFSVLREGESSVEYLLENLSLIASRLEKKHKLNKKTLRVYKSRVKSSLEDYLDWCRDPLGWEQSVLNRTKRKSEKQTAPVKRTKRIKAPVRMEMRTPRKTGGRRLSFPIREDFDVEVIIPENGLSSKELLKLQLFLYSFCHDGGDVGETWLPVSTTAH